MINKKIISSVALLISFVLLISGCSGSGKQDAEGNALHSKKEYPVMVSDIKFDSAPKGVIVLSSSIADIINTLKYNSFVVGRSDECTNSEFLNVTAIGSIKALDIDKIKSLNTELILTDEVISIEQKTLLEQNNMKILLLPSAANREQLTKLYTNLGAIFGGANTGYSKASERVNNILNTVDNINKIIPQSDAPATACYMYDVSGSVVTGDKFGSQLIELSGASNIAKNYTSSSMNINYIVEKNPTYIFCKPGVLNQIKQDPSLSQLSAVQNSHVYEMGPSLIEYQGNTIIEAVTFMVSHMHPELLSEINYTPEEQQSSAVFSESPSSSSVSEQPQSSAESAAPLKTLKLGDSGDDVYKMQARLKELGHMYVDPDGKFDDMTVQGVINFQFLSGFDATGIADESTLNKLYASDAVTGPDYKS